MSYLFAGFPFKSNRSKRLLEVLLADGFRIEYRADAISSLDKLRGADCYILFVDDGMDYDEHLKQELTEAMRANIPLFAIYLYGGVQMPAVYKFILSTVQAVFYDRFTYDYDFLHQMREYSVFKNSIGAPRPIASSMVSATAELSLDSKQGDSVFFGRYKLPNGKIIPLEWIVEGYSNRVYRLILKTVIPVPPIKTLCYAKSPLRSYLANEFLMSSFNEEERSRMISREVAIETFFVGIQTQGESEEKVYTLFGMGDGIVDSCMENPSLFAASSIISGEREPYYIFSHGGFENSIAIIERDGSLNDYGVDLNAHGIHFRPRISVIYYEFNIDKGV